MNAMTQKSNQGTSLIQIARAKDTTPDQLENLLTTPNPVVAINIAGRTDLNDELAARLSVDSRAAVRLRVAKNPATPRHVLERLQHDTSEGVREAAVSTLVQVSIQKDD